MTLQKRFQRIMKRRGWRVADLARELGEPYTTVREWVLKGRYPTDLVGVGETLERLESMSEK